VGGGSGVTLAYKLLGGSLLLTPREARARNIPLEKLTNTEVATLEVLAEGLVPDSVDAGVSHFIDYNLSLAANDCMLIAKYFQVPTPYLDFYRTGLALCETLGMEKNEGGLKALDSAELHQFLTTMGQTDSSMDSNFNLALFYLCLRSDAVDVVYGVPEGFARLGIPYMAHIDPPENWHA